MTSLQRLRSACLLYATLGLSLTLPTLTGCATVEKATGSKESYFSGNPEQVAAAAKAACEELKLRNVRSTASRVDAQVDAETAQGKAVSIKIKSAGSDSSSMLIRIGAFGDSDISHAIMDETTRKLNQSRP